MFGLVIAVAIAGTATISAFVVSANAQPPDTFYCARNIGKPTASACFDTKEDCEAFADLVSGRQVCIPRHVID